MAKSKDRIECVGCRTSIPAEPTIADLLEIGWRPQDQGRYKCPHCVATTKIDLDTVKSVPTRIRRVYFDQIKAQNKGVEIRRLSEYWDRRFIGDGETESPKVLVLVCGHDVYRCVIETSWVVKSQRCLEDILGRSPSAQGWDDIGREPPWLAMFLGREVENV